MAKNRIILTPTDRPVGQGKASESILPGAALELVPSGPNQGQLRKAATAGGNIPGWVAIENSEIGKGVADAYAANDLVTYYSPAPGEEVQVLLSDGETVEPGDGLEVGANAGEFVKHTPRAVDEGGAATFTLYLNAVRYIAKEAVTNGSGNPTLIIAERV